MGMIGREPARAPLTSADINNDIITADDLVTTLDLSSKTLTLPTLSSATITSVDINGGTLDGVTIGGSSAGAITGTTGQFNTSLNVDGAVTADGLTVDGQIVTIQDSTSPRLIIKDTTNNYVTDIRSINNDTYISADPDNVVAGSAMHLRVDGKTFQKIDSTGDISFFEDTGTTPKFFWDASAESLGIGFASTPASKLHIANTGVGLPASSGTTQTYGNIRTAGAGSNVVLDIGNAGATGVWLQANNQINLAVTAPLLLNPNGGNVGIGTSSPDSNLHVLASSAGAVTALSGTTLTVERDNNNYITLLTGDADVNALVFGSPSNNNNASINGYYNGGSQYLNINVAGAERMRITSSGNVGIGTSSPSNTLHVAKDTGSTPTVYINNSGSDAGDGVALKVQASGRGTGIGDTSVFSVHNDSSELFTVRNDGNVGIGTSDPDTKLEVLGGAPILTVRDTTTSMSSAVSTLRLAESSGSNLGSYWDIAAKSDGWDLAFTHYSSGEAMRINSGGDLLVGATSTTDLLNGDKLFVQGGDIAVRSDPSGLAWRQGALIFDIRNSNGQSKAAYIRSEISADVNSDIRFFTTVSNVTAERMRIDSAGNLLVGTTSAAPGSSNTNVGCAFEGATGVVYGSRASGASGIFNANADGQLVRCHRSGSLVGSISVTTTATAYNTSSDYRLKDVDGPITNSGAYIDALKPVQGSWKADGSRFIGLIAHEVQEVSETPIATGEKDGEEIQGMDYSAPELIANLIAEIQSLRARVAQLEGA